MMAFLVLILAGWMITEFSEPARAQAPPEVESAGDWKARLDAQYPEAPEEILKPCLELIKATPYYALACEFEAAKLEPEVKKWSEELKLELKTEKAPFLWYFWDTWGLHDKERFKILGREFRLLTNDFEIYRNFSIDVILLMLEKAGNSETQLYRVSRRRLKEFLFEFVPAIQIVDPLNRNLSQFNVSQNFHTVIERLCKLGEADFVMSMPVVSANNESQMQYIVMDLRDCTVQDCIAYAALAAGRKFNNVIQGVARSSNERIQDQSVITWEVYQRIFKLRVESELEGEKPQEISPLEALKGKVVENAAAMRKNRPSLHFGNPRE